MLYHEYIGSKLASRDFTGVPFDSVSDRLFPFQRELVTRALRAGRYALFTDTGTGKTAMQLEFARHAARHGNVLIICPLAVSCQTVREAESFGIKAEYRRRFGEKHEHSTGWNIIVTNYEMAQAFDPDDFCAVVLDESSILKSFDGKTRNMLISMFGETRWRLACTATPAPNDHMELGNHSEFLGHKSRSEMLAEYFVHDGSSTQAWRLKGHAVDRFWGWVASWSSIMRLPSDLGFSDDGYVLPDLVMHEDVIPAKHEDARQMGMLFLPDAISLNEQRSLRRSTTSERVELARDVASSHDTCLVWAELNSEAEEATKAIAGAVNLQGSDSIQSKADKLEAFSNGEIRVLVTKPKIAGFGMNWQHCNAMVFMGASHSFESTYQAIRRCWRFGQKKPVHVHFVRHELEEAIIRNFKRKQKQHADLMSSMSRYSASGQVHASEHNTQHKEIPAWLKH
jgi:superfamily II DNA or RNA helicase